MERKIEHRKIEPFPQLAPFAGGLLAGWLSVVIVRQVRKLLTQPKVSTATIHLEEPGVGEVSELGLLITVANLLSGVEKRRLPNGQEKLVLCAGRRHFREPWARDLGFASFGLAEIRQYQVMRESFEVFLMNQLPSGQLPIKVHSTNILERYLHSLLGREQPIRSAIRPKYFSGHNTLSLDGNALLVIAMLNYGDRSGDHEFIRTHWQALKQALTWLESQVLGEDGLLHQAAYSDWADSIARAGRILYTNVLYWKSLKEMANAAGLYGVADEAAYYSSKEAQVNRAIHDLFWRDDLGYFVTSEVFNTNLSSSGNLMAIAWDLATTEQAHSILDAMDRFGMADPIPTKPTFPPYPNRYVAIENRLGRMGFYHMDAAWLWLGAWHIIALSHVGRLAEAESLLQKIMDIIVMDGAVHEVYSPDGRYVSGFWYQSDAPFTWSSGMIVYAYQIFQSAIQQRDLSFQVQVVKTDQ
jgi:GH15 family glucan-1,4-alpha-glucosidase